MCMSFLWLTATTTKTRNQLLNEFLQSIRFYSRRCVLQVKIHINSTISVRLSISVNHKNHCATYVSCVALRQFNNKNAFIVVEIVCTLLWIHIDLLFPKCGNQLAQVLLLLEWCFLRNVWRALAIGIIGLHVRTNYGLYKEHK